MKLFVQSLHSDDAPPTPTIDLEFIAMGDPQWRDPSGGPGARDSVNLKWSIRDSVVHAEANKGDSDFLLVLGDYMDLQVDMSTSQYADMNTIMENYTGDLFCIAGNHDVGNASQNSNIVQDFYNELEPTFTSIGDLHTLGYGYVKRSNGLHIIALNSAEASYTGFASGTETNGRGDISDTQMQWLRDTLDSINEPNAKLMVTTHFQLDDYLDFSSYNVERTRRYEILHFIAKWQKESDNGVCIGILTGHRHENEEYEYNGHFGKLNAITFNDSLSTDYTGYTGDENNVSDQEEFMNYGKCKYIEETKTFSVQGVGLQSNYSIALADRITEPYVPAPTTEKPIIGTLSVSSVEFRLATLNCTATHSVGVVGYQVWYKSVGGDLVEYPTAFLQRIIYSQTVDDFIIGQISSGGTIEIYLIAIDEQGNESVKSNTVSFTGG